MKSDSFVRAAKIDELRGAGPFAASANGVDVVLVQTRSGWRAFQGRCPHQGALLGEGEIEGDALVCRNHRWRFSIASGLREGGPECLISCPTVERGGELLVDVSGLTRASRKPAPTPSIDDLPGPKGLPLVGNLHQLEPDKVHLILERWVREYGPVYQFRMGADRVVATSNPALIEEVLRARPETFLRGVKQDTVLSELGIVGVFNAEGEAWRSQRRLSVAALAQRHLRQLYPHIKTVAERLRGRWLNMAEAGENLDIVDELKRFTVDVTMLIVFGYDANTVEQSDDVIQRQLEVILPGISRRIFAPVPTWRYVRLPADRRLDRALLALRAWLESLLEASRARLEAEPERMQRPSNFVEAMLSAVDEDGEPFSADVIMSNLITMLLAGEDTTAFTLAWAIHELCDNPSWSFELRREADGVLGAMPVAVDADCAGRLARANAVANEVLRLRPAAPFLIMSANVDTALGDYFIPQGTGIATLLRLAALDQAHFADPLAFRPERWLDDWSGAHEVSAHLPFGSGPRMCPGRSLALLEMKTCLAMLYRSFDVERVGDFEGRRRALRLHDVAVRAQSAAQAAEAVNSTAEAVVVLRPPARERQGRLCRLSEAFFRFCASWIRLRAAFGPQRFKGSNSLPSISL